MEHKTLFFYDLCYIVIKILLKRIEKYPIHALNHPYTHSLTTNAWVFATRIGAAALFGSKYTRSIKKTFPKFLSSMTAHGDFIVVAVIKEDAAFSFEHARSDVANAAE